MGNQASAPRPGTKFRVIGAGLPRTGTASFSEALRILLDGPVYHGGTQVTIGPPEEIRSWIKLLSHWPPTNGSDKTLVSRMLKERFDGYAAAADSPACGLVKELMEIYPDAKVICTVRDPDGWVKSMETVSNAATMGFLRVVLFPLPGMRHFVDYINVLRKQWLHRFGETEPVTALSYHRHIEQLKTIVPEDRLVFFSVKDGWGPLCKALGKEVPDIPFPRINDGEAIDRFSKRIINRALLRWLVIVITVGLAAVPFFLSKRFGSYL